MEVVKAVAMKHEGGGGEGNGGAKAHTKALAVNGQDAAACGPHMHTMCMMRVSDRWCRMQGW